LHPASLHPASLHPASLHPASLHHLLDVLIQKYENNEYVYGRLCNYMEKLLPVALDNSVTVYKQREERKKQLTTDKDEFTSRFIQKNNYFYSTHSELFLHYDGLHFKSYSEDDIQHQILSTITNEQSLMEWKHKTNTNIIKRIKDKSPLNAIPESATIQYVINSLYPAFFTTRNQVKYFLTIIGDSLTTKQHASSTATASSTSTASSTAASSTAASSTAAYSTSTPSSLIYIISSSFKELLREINNQSYAFFGISTILNNIKFKYYDHNYKDCRLIQFNNKCKKMSLTPDLLKHMIDLLCVASHYSQRYGSADGFLQKCTEAKLVDHVLFLNKNTTESIVDRFLERTVTVMPSAKMNSKNIVYLWKNYLAEQNIPNIIFYSALKNMLKEKYKYEEETDTYLDITSAQLPIVAKFIKFWETTTAVETDSELEVDEILILFKQFNSANGKTNNNNGVSLNETVLLDLIHHFYPDVSVADNKFIQNVKSNIWDKRNDVINALELFKLKCSEQEEELTKSLNDAYEYYTSLSAGANMANTINVSKRYFERVAVELINNHIDEDGLIKSSWWKG
jgi:hypothetical protein